MHFVRLLFAVITATAIANGSTTRHGSHGSSGEALHVRNYFYAGGEYASDGANGTIFQNQMYVEQLTPLGGAHRPYPLVLIHGQAQTGTNFLNKPDGGRGWASYFLSQGYEVYIVDQTFRGRSAWKPGNGASKPTTYSAEYIQQRFTAPQDYNLWPQAVYHTQWNGTGKMGDPVFDAFYASNVQFINNDSYSESAVQAAGTELLDRIGKPVVLVGHSQGGFMPMLIADARPELAKALILLEPKGPPFQEAVFSNASARPYGLTDVPITYSPAVTNASMQLVRQTYPAPSAEMVNCILQAPSPPPRQLTNLAPKPILVVTTEASYHAMYDYCTVRYLKQAGCNQTEHLELGKVEIHGNGHMMFMEKNSDEIAEVLRHWVEKL